MTVPTREIRFTEDQIAALIDAARRRRLELDRRLERTSYDGKPGMKDAVVTERGLLFELERALRHNREQLQRHGR